MEVFFGIDIGGTNIKIALFDNSDNLIDKSSIKTNKNSNAKNVFTDIKNETTRLLNKNKINKDKVKGYGFGLPGPIKDNVVVRCPNLGWGKTDINKVFKDVFKENTLVAASNDALLASYGEYKNLNKKEDIVFVTLGTGVGGGVILNGKILQGAHGAAGEVGHIQVEYENPFLCSCGLYGCLETVSSIKGFKEVGLKLLKDYNGPTRLTRTTLNPPNIFNLAAKNDKLAIKIIDKITDYIARALAKVSLVVDPHTIIIGGGISNAGKPLIDKIAKNYKKYCHYGVSKVKIQLANLGSDAGSYGAYYLIKEQFYNK